MKEGSDIAMDGGVAGGVGGGPPVRDWETDGLDRAGAERANELLCEGCGYVLEGSRSVPACPECGLAVADSMPERRKGTPWQQRPSVGNWLCTSWMTLRHPARTFRAARIDPALRWRDEGLLWDNLAAASVLGLLVLMLGFAGDVFSALGGVATAVVFSPIVVLPLAMLTELERIGIRFFGRRRGWRIDRAASLVVCAHASIGWVIATVLASVGFLVSWPLHDLVRRQYTPGAANAYSLDVYRAIPVVMPLLGFFVGLLVFETLVWIGVRACKFANRPQSQVGERPA